MSSPKYRERPRPEYTNQPSPGPDSVAPALGYIICGVLAAALIAALATL